MRPFTEYPTLTTDDLQVELAQVVGLLYNTIGEFARVKSDYDREHLIAYYQSTEESHAARSRYADRQTSSLADDVLTFEQNILAYRVLHDYLTNLIDWRING